MMKECVLAMTLALGIGLSGAAVSALPSFNHKIYNTGEQVAEKPRVMRDFIEMHNARGFDMPYFMTLDGKKVPMKDLENRLTMLFVWATWNEPTKRLLPQVIDLQKTFNKEGSKVKILGVSVDKKAKRVTKFLKKNGFEAFETLQDPTHLMKGAAPLDVIPTIFALDGKGNLVGFVRGYSLDWSDPAIVPYLEKLGEKYAHPKTDVAPK